MNLSAGETEEPRYAAPDLHSLRGRFRAALLRRGEEGYEESRRILNGATRSPATYDLTNFFRMNASIGPT